MPIESVAHGLSTTPWSAPTPCASFNGTGDGGQGRAVLGNGGDSLGVSSIQASLKLAWLDAAIETIAQTASASSLYTPFAESLFPAIVDTACFEAEPRRIRQLAADLRMAFADAPVEDGINHPAEQIIDEALRWTPKSHVSTLLWEMALDVDNPDLAASITRCLGRGRPGTPGWRVRLVRAALELDDVEMRDAAAQAAESWGGEDMREVLRRHVETVPWLHTYIEEVIEELRS